MAVSDVILVRFRCGHKQAVGGEAHVPSIACLSCGERRVADVQAPPPVIRATDCDAKSPLLQENPR